METSYNHTYNHHNHRHRFYYRVLLFGLITILALAPLPLGSNRPLYWHLLSVFSALLFIFWLVGLCGKKEGRELKLSRIWYVSIPYFACIAWIIMQITVGRPEPHPLWYPIMVALNTGQPVLQKISISPQDTLEGLIRYLTYGMAFWIAVQISHYSSTYAYSMVKSLVIIGVVYAIYGIVAFSLNKNGIVTYPNSDLNSYYLTSTFINRNNYASYAGMLLITSLSIILIDVSRFIRIRKIKGLGPTLRYILSNHLIYFGFALIILTSLLFTLSRAGFLFSTIGLSLIFVLPIFSATFKTLRKALLLFCLVMGMMMAVFINYAGKDTYDRIMNTDNDIIKRQAIYHTTLLAIKDYRNFGSGLGTFEYAFQPYISEENVSPYRIEKAHNTYLENILELGFMGFLILMTCFITLHIFFLFNIFISHAKDSYAMLALAVSTQLGGHALFDFSLQIPAIMYSYAVILGLCLGQMHKRSKLEEKYG